MSLTRGALLQDETIRGRLFVASNGFPVFALLKAIIRHFARRLSKGRARASIAIPQCCAVPLYARHPQTGRCKIFLRDFEERKRDRLPASGERIGCGGWI